MVLGSVVALAGCPAEPSRGEAVEDGAGSTGEGESSSGGGGDGQEAEESDETGMMFIVKPDGGIGFACDLFAQDCLEGQKCVPWADDGGNVWNATVCRDLDDDVQEVGDPCTVEGSGTSGLDDCRLGAMCWDVDAETNTGTCVAMCEGDETAPLCSDPSTVCTIANDGALALCLPTCDPLLQDCGTGQACYPVNADWACAPDASGTMGLTGEPCGAVNACDPGLVCATAAALSDCASDLCCTSLCDTASAGADASCDAAGAGQVCEAFYLDGQAPPGLETVGLCLLPQ